MPGIVPRALHIVSFDPHTGTMNKGSSLHPGSRGSESEIEKPGLRPAPGSQTSGHITCHSDVGSAWGISACILGGSLGTYISCLWTTLISSSKGSKADFQSHPGVTEARIFWAMRAGKLEISALGQN